MVAGESLVLGMSAPYHAGEQNIADIVLVIILHRPMVGKIAQAVPRRLKDAMRIHAQVGLSAMVELIEWLEGSINIRMINKLYNVTTKFSSQWWMGRLDRVGRMSC